MIGFAALHMKGYKYAQQEKHLLTLLRTDSRMRSLARAIPLHYFKPPPGDSHCRIEGFRRQPPGAVLTILDRCPLNIDLHWRSPHQNLSSPRVLVSTTATYHRQQKKLLTAVPNVWEFESNSFVHTRQEERSLTKKGFELLPHLEALPRKGFGLQSNILWLILTPGLLCPRFLMSCTPQSQKSWIWLVFHIPRTFQHRGLNVQFSEQLSIPTASASMDMMNNYVETEILPVLFRLSQQYRYITLDMSGLAIMEDKPIW